MTVLEYVQKLTNNQIVVTEDEYGNAYLDLSNVNTWYDMDFLYVFATSEYKGSIFISKENMDRLKEYRICVKEDDIFDGSATRRPYYRMRGCPVTKEQAFDIVRRTDNFFKFYVHEIRMHPDFVGNMNFDNWLIAKNHCPMGYGWIHTDGTVGCNAITQKYPSNIEYIAEWLENLIAFPFLDLIIAVTFWDEAPSKTYYMQNPDDRYAFEFEDEEFFDSIDTGIYIHDKTIEILGPEQTVKKYREYAALYEDENRGKYVSDFYENNSIVQVNEEYLKRCIESYGLNADFQLRKVPEYIWKGR